MDPARTDPVYAALSYVHPALAVAGLLGALLVLRTGLRLRDGRLRRRPPPAEVARQHVRLAPLAVWVLAIAFVLGPLSALLLRHWKVLRTFHGWMGVLAALCFVAAGLLGRRLRVQPDQRRSLHGNLGLLGMLAGLVAALTGIALLP